MRRIVWMVLLVGVGWAGQAEAERRGRKDNAAEARRLFEQGTKYFLLRDFERAIVAFKGAFEARPDAVELYNIAQAYRLKGDYDNALYFYRSYRRVAPAAENLAEIERRISELEAAAAQREMAKRPPNETVRPGSTGNGLADPFVNLPAPGAPERRKAVPSPAKVVLAPARSQADGATAPAARRSPRPIYRKWWFWAGIGVIAAAGTTALVLARPAAGGAPHTSWGVTEGFGP